MPIVWHAFHFKILNKNASGFMSLCQQGLHLKVKTTMAPQIKSLDQFQDDLLFLFIVILVNR